MFLKRKSFLWWGLLSLAGCASSYQLNSVPTGANVYYLEGNGEKKLFLGSTPVNYSKSLLPENQAFLLMFEKEGYSAQIVPVAATDESKTILNVRMKVQSEKVKPPAKETNILVRRLFLAQEMMYRKEYVAAMQEVERLVHDYPEAAQPHVIRGTIYYLLNEVKSAKKSWRAALELDPENVELLKFLKQNRLKLDE